jgi:hypothetical protein
MPASDINADVERLRVSSFFKVMPSRMLGVSPSSSLENIHTAMRGGPLEVEVPLARTISGCVPAAGAEGRGAEVGGGRTEEVGGRDLSAGREEEEEEFLESDMYGVQMKVAKNDEGWRIYKMQKKRQESDTSNLSRERWPIRASPTLVRYTTTLRQRSLCRANALLGHGCCWRGGAEGKEVGDRSGATRAARVTRCISAGSTLRRLNPSRVAPQGPWLLRRRQAANLRTHSTLHFLTRNGTTR